MMKVPKSNLTSQVTFGPTSTDTDLVAPLTGSGTGNAPEVSVDKIRDLLFGNQMQDYDRRFSELEERSLERFKEIESETTRSLGAFESNTKKHLDSLASQFREEKDQRVDADKENDRALREQGQAMEKRIRQLSDQVSQLDRDIADRVTRETQALRDEIKQKNADLRSTLEKMFGELSNVKTDRNLLAGLFIEVAKCLNQDIGSKGKASGADPLRGFPGNKAT
jgi:vacuolar-type H+-ATPase subunit I/STV1